MILLPRRALSGAQRARLGHRLALALAWIALVTVVPAMAAAERLTHRLQPTDYLVQSLRAAAQRGTLVGTCGDWNAMTPAQRWTISELHLIVATRQADRKIMRPSDGLLRALQSYLSEQCAGTIAPNLSDLVGAAVTARPQYTDSNAWRPL